jgi:hypothetical protein
VHQSPKRVPELSSPKDHACRAACQRKEGVRCA